MALEKIAPELLEVLACPACKSKLDCRVAPHGDLYCGHCRRAYAVQNGIPILVLEAPQNPSTRQ